jgi:tetratricopeptide (TPR) repeat protein
MSFQTDQIEAAKKRAIALLLALATIAVFGRACADQFVNYDDDVYVTQNSSLNVEFGPSGLGWAFTTFQAANWHPLTWLSLALDQKLSHGSPFGFHLTNVLLHVANVVLLFVVLARLTGAVWCSAFTAALFALHPLHVESVAWAAERKDVLCGFFFMLTLCAYRRYVQSTRVGTGQAGYYLVLMLAFSLALMAKPMAVTLPLVLLLLDYWPLGRWEVGGAAPGLLVEKAPLLVLSVVSSWLTWRAQSQAGTLHSLWQMPLERRAATAVEAYVIYLGKTLWPIHLAPFYPYAEESVSQQGNELWPTLVAASVLVVLTALALRLARQRPYGIVGWLWYVVMLVPVIGLVQVGRQALADRYTYLPLVGIFIIVAWGLADLANRLRQQAVVSGAALVVLAMCVALTWQQLGHWQNSIRLWEHTLMATESNYLAHYNLGKALEEQGRQAEALRHYEDAIAIRPNYSEAHDNAGILLQKHGKNEEAIGHFRVAVQSDPTNPYAHNNLGQALAQRKQLSEAVGHFEEALRLKPDFAQAHDNCGVALALQGDRQRALLHFEEAVRLEPKIGKYYYDLAHAEKCVQPATAASVDSGPARFYRQAASLDPRWPISASEAAWTLATSPDQASQYPELAVLLAEQVCDAGEWAQPAGWPEIADRLDTLAAAYASAGRFEDAQRVARSAVSLSDVRKLSAMKERLRLYQARKTYRDTPGKRSKWDEK